MSNKHDPIDVPGKVAENTAANPSAVTGVWSYLLAVALLGAALVLRLAFDPLWGNRLAYAWFFLAVLAMTRWGGTGPQLLTVCGGLMLGNWFFVSPRYSFWIHDRADQVNAAIYIGICLLILHFSARTRRAVRRELATRDRIAGILECTSDAVCTIDREWRVIYFNQRAAALANLKTDQVRGRNFWEVWPEIMDTRFESEYRNVMEQRRPVHFEEYDQLRQRWLEVHAFPYGNGLTLFFRDVNNRKRAEASRAQLAAIVDSSDDAIIGQSAAGSIITWNAAAGRLYGYTQSEAIGRPFAMLFPAGSEAWIADVLERVRRGERISHFEMKQQKKDGGEVDVSLTISPVHKVDLQNVDISVTARDVSGRKRAEEERERLIGELQAAMAQVKTLSGLLPICAQCKKIRDDKGSWNQIEVYIRERSNANFSHGICPDCARHLYPQLYS